MDYLTVYDTTTLTTWTDPAIGEGTNATSYFYVVRTEDIYANEESNINMVGKHPISLTAGWNIVSLPFMVPGGVVDALSSIAGQYSAVQSYNSATGLWEVYYPDQPGWLNTLDSVDGRAFWLDVDVDTTLMSLGNVQLTTDIQLKKGWNMVAYPSLNNTVDINTAYAGISWDMVQTSGAGPYNLIDLAGFDLMTTGRGYWVHVTTDDTVTISL